MRRRSFASEGSLVEDEPEGTARGRARAYFLTQRRRVAKCAEELCFGGRPHEVRPMVWPDRRSLRGAKSLEA